MTIKEAAALYGVSKQAIYQRLKKTGQDLDQIRDAKTQELTEFGIELVNSIYGQKADKEQSSVNQSVKELESLKSENVRLQEQVNALTEKVAALTEERDFLRRSLDQSQQLQAMTLSRLPASTPPAGEKKGLIKRLAEHFKRPEA